MTFTEAGDQAIPADATVTAVLTTSCGDITLELDPSIAPETVNSFVFLAREGYFDGSPIHRIIPSIHDAGWRSHRDRNRQPGLLAHRRVPRARHHLRPGDRRDGQLGRAPGTAGSQFFIVLEENQLHLLPNQFTSFGQLVGSEATIDAIKAVPLGYNEFDQDPSRPLESVYIESVTITVG